MIDPTKKYRTRDGSEVRIYAVDAGGAYPVHGAIKDDGNRWNPETWDESGYYDRDRRGDRDLIEVPPTVTLPEFWLNKYDNDSDARHWSRETADAATATTEAKRLACVHYPAREVPVGEGLEKT